MNTRLGDDLDNGNTLRYLSQYISDFQSEVDWAFNHNIMSMIEGNTLNLRPFIVKLQSILDMVRIKNIGYDDSVASLFEDLEFTREMFTDYISQAQMGNSDEINQIIDQIEIAFVGSPQNLVFEGHQRAKREVEETDLKKSKEEKTEQVSRNLEIRRQKEIIEKYNSAKHFLVLFGLPDEVFASISQLHRYPTEFSVDLLTLVIADCLRYLYDKKISQGHIYNRHGASIDGGKMKQIVEKKLLNSKRQDTFTQHSVFSEDIFIAKAFLAALGYLPGAIKNLEYFMSIAMAKNPKDPAVDTSVTVDLGENIGFVYSVEDIQNYGSEITTEQGLPATKVTLKFSYYKDRSGDYIFDIITMFPVIK